MRHAGYIFLSLIIATPALLFGCTGQKGSPGLHEFSGSTMGTTYTVKIVDSTPEFRRYRLDGIKAGMEKILDVVNGQMSTYISNSELSLFNRYEKTEWFPVSADLINVVQSSLSISRESRGALDITIGSLVNLWGFGPVKKDVLPPDDKDVKKRLAQTGRDRISTRLSPPSIKKEVVDMYLDLSAVAKGFAVDRLAGYLDSLNVMDYLVEVGGEVRTKGKNHPGKTWQVGISTPDDRQGIQKVVLLNDRCMATSGDYRSYFEKDGVRYSHTIDPRTGRPVTHGLASVSVINDSCMTADGMATAIMVLGPEEGFGFALEKRLAVFMIVKDKDEFTEKMTPEFKSYIQ